MHYLAVLSLLHTSSPIYTCPYHNEYHILRPISQIQSIEGGQAIGIKFQLTISILSLWSSKKIGHWTFFVSVLNFQDFRTVCALDAHWLAHVKVVATIFFNWNLPWNPLAFNFAFNLFNFDFNLSNFKISKWFGNFAHSSSTFPVLRLCDKPWSVCY